MKKQFLIAMAVMLLPALALAQGESWNMGIEKRVADLEKRVDAIESKWNQGSTRSTTPGHEILRGPEIEEGAPVLTNDAIVSLYIKNEADISKIWKSLPEEKTMRDAVERWLNMKSGKICDCILSGKCDCGGNCKCPGCPVHRCVSPDVMKGIYKDQDDKQKTFGVSWKGTKPTNKGRELLYFGTSTCVHCPAAVSRLGALTKEIICIDCSEDDTLAAMHQVTSYPTLICIEDGIKVSGLHTEGTSVGSFLASKWLGKEAPAVAASSGHTHSGDVANLRQHMMTEHHYTTAQIAAMTDDEVERMHNSSHGTKTSSTPKAVIRSVPMVTKSYSPQVTRPSYSTGPSYSSGRNVTRYGGSTWTWPGNLRQHLESVHRVSTAGLSDSQLRTVHDNLHNTGRSGITGGGYASSGNSSGYRAAMPRQTSYYRPTTYFASGRSYGSSCPSGNCPR